MFEMGSMKSIVSFCGLIVLAVMLTIGGIMYVANKREGAPSDNVNTFSRQVITIEHDGHQFIAVILPNLLGTVRNIIHHPDCECIE